MEALAAPILHAVLKILVICVWVVVGVWGAYGLAFGLAAAIARRALK